jgi:uncharacterized protein YlxW (UPF0749 family)
MERLFIVISVFFLAICVILISVAKQEEQRTQLLEQRTARLLDSISDLQEKASQTQIQLNEYQNSLLRFNKENPKEAKKLQEFFDLQNCY